MSGVTYTKSHVEILLYSLFFSPWTTKLVLVCQNNKQNTLHNLLHIKSGLFSKVKKSVESTTTTGDSAPEISSVFAVRNEHQDRSGWSDTGLDRSPCYSFEVGYIFISSLLAHELPFTRFFLIRGEGEQFTSEEHQTGPFHSVRLVVRVNGDWSLQCPFYEHIVIKWG